MPPTNLNIEIIGNGFSYSMLEEGYSKADAAVSRDIIKRCLTISAVDKKRPPIYRKIR
jgi:hypothetical protein